MIKIKHNPRRKELLRNNRELFRKRIGYRNISIENLINNPIDYNEDNIKLLELDIRYLEDCIEEINEELGDE